MELLPKDIQETLPELYANEELGLAAQALVKLFTPDSSCTWYGSEFDGEDIIVERATLEDVVFYTGRTGQEGLRLNDNSK